MNTSATIIDIRELDDRDSRVVGYVYTDTDGTRFVQASAFMSLWTVERLGFRFSPGALTSNWRRYDGSPLGLTISSCRHDHIVSNLVVKNFDRDMEAAFYSGLDVLPPDRRREYLDVWIHSFGTGDPGKEAP